MTPPTETQGQTVYPGIVELKANPPTVANSPLWSIDGRVEHGVPDDPESWGWLATVSSGWDDKDGGELARFLVRAANAHAPLVEALAGLVALVSAAFPASGPAITAEARAALALAREGARP